MSQASAASPQRHVGPRAATAAILAAVLLAVLAGALFGMPAICRRYFWGWWGSQPVVIERLAEQERWQGALDRAQRLVAERPWDPRGEHRIADLLWRRAAARQEDPASDSEVAAAFEQVGRGYFKTLYYPYLLSPDWVGRMTSAFNRWGLCAARAERWPIVAFCLEMAADINPASADSVITNLIRQSSDPVAVPDEMLTALVRLVLWHRSPEEALDVLGRIEAGFTPVDAASLRLECELADPERTEFASIPITRDEAMGCVPLRLLQVRRIERVMNEDDGAMIARLTSFLRSQSVGNLVSTENLHEAAETSRFASGEWTLVTDSELAWTWDPPAEVSDPAWLIARGSPVLGVWPVLEVAVNGGESQLVYVRGREWQSLPIRMEPGLLTSLTVRFVNDGGFSRLSPAGESEQLLEDRNVRILGLWMPQATLAGLRP